MKVRQLIAILCLALLVWTSLAAGGDFQADLAPVLLLICTLAAFVGRPPAQRVPPQLVYVSSLGLSRAPPAR